MKNSFNPPALGASNRVGLEEHCMKIARDAEDQVIDRRGHPLSLAPASRSVDTIEKLIARLDKAHYEAERDF